MSKNIKAKVVTVIRRSGKSTLHIPRRFLRVFLGGAEDKKVSRQNTMNKNRSDYKRYFTGTAFERKFIDEIIKSDIEGVAYMNLNRGNSEKSDFLTNLNKNLNPNGPFYRNAKVPQSLIE